LSSVASPPPSNIGQFGCFLPKHHHFAVPFLMWIQCQNVQWIELQKLDELLILIIISFYKKLSSLDKIFPCVLHFPVPTQIYCGSWPKRVFDAPYSSVIFAHSQKDRPINVWFSGPNPNVPTNHFSISV
jgi:hypothetical protein